MIQTTDVRELMEIVSDNPHRIAHIERKNQTEELQLMAVSKLPYLLGIIHNPSTDVILAALRSSSQNDEESQNNDFLMQLAMGPYEEITSYITRDL